MKISPKTHQIAPFKKISREGYTRTSLASRIAEGNSPRPPKCWASLANLAYTHEFEKHLYRTLRSKQFLAGFGGVSYVIVGQSWTFVQKLHQSI